MHEWALAEAVVETVRREAGGGRVRRVDLRLGELQQIDRESFDFALRELAAESSMGSAAFVVSSDPARFRCRRCDHAWGFEGAGALSREKLEAIHFLPESAHAYASCPTCGSVDFDITAGRGAWIAEIEYEEPEAKG